MDKDYYAILGVAKSASAGEIKRAYQKLVLKYHPDRTGGPKSASEFKEVCEAYRVLSDISRRHRYDESRYRAYKSSRARQDNAYTAPSTRSYDRPRRKESESAKVKVSYNSARVIIGLLEAGAGIGALIWIISTNDVKGGARIFLSFMYVIFIVYGYHMFSTPEKQETFDW